MFFHSRLDTPVLMLSDIFVLETTQNELEKNMLWNISHSLFFFKTTTNKNTQNATSILLASNLQARGGVPLDRNPLDLLIDLAATRWWHLEEPVGPKPTQPSTFFFLCPLELMHKWSLSQPHFKSLQECVCVCVCVCARARARVCVCERPLSPNTRISSNIKWRKSVGTAIQTCAVMYWIVFRRDTMTSTVKWAVRIKWLTIPWNNNKKSVCRRLFSCNKPVSHRLLQLHWK